MIIYETSDNEIIVPLKKFYREHRSDIVNVVNKYDFEVIDYKFTKDYIGHALIPVIDVQIKSSDVSDYIKLKYELSEYFMKFDNLGFFITHNVRDIFDIFIYEYFN